MELSWDNNDFTEYIKNESFIETIRKTNKKRLKKSKIAEIISAIFNPKGNNIFKIKNFYTLLINAENTGIFSEEMLFSKKSKIIKEEFNDIDFIEEISKLNVSIEYKLLLAVIAVGFRDMELNEYIIDYCKDRGFITYYDELGEQYKVFYKGKEVKYNKDIILGENKFKYKKLYSVKVYFDIINQFNRTTVFSSAYKDLDLKEKTTNLFNIAKSVSNFKEYLNNVIYSIHNFDLKYIINSKQNELPIFYKNNLQCLDILLIVNKYCEVFDLNYIRLNYLGNSVAYIVSNKNKKVKKELDFKKEIVNSIDYNNIKNTNDKELSKLITLLLDSSDMEIVNLIKEEYYEFRNKKIRDCQDKETLNRIIIDKINEKFPSYWNNFVKNFNKEYKNLIFILNTANDPENLEEIPFKYTHDSEYYKYLRNFFRRVSNFYFKLLSITKLKYITVEQFSEYYSRHQFLLANFINNRTNNIKIFDGLYNSNKVLALEFINDIIDEASYEMVENLLQ